MTLPVDLTWAVGLLGGTPQRPQEKLHCRRDVDRDPQGSPTQPPTALPGGSRRPALTRHDGGRKLLTLETLHMPSRHCWAWMVTVLSAPPRPAGATDTWTLGPDGQAGPFLLSGPAWPGRAPAGPAGTGASLGPVMAPGLGGVRPGPPRRVSRSSRPAGACSSRRASRVSWVRWVAQTSQWRSTSGRHTGRTPGAGSLSRSRAERQGSWGTRDDSGQSTGAQTCHPLLPRSTGPAPAAAAA